MKQAVVIFNPTSGKKRKRNWISKMETIFTEYQYQMQVLETNYPGHAIELVKNLLDVDLVVSMGGDGTLNEVVRGNLKRKHRLLIAHLPYGSANDIGKMYGLGKNLYRNLRLLLSGTVRQVDLCKINEEPFVYVAGFGNFIPISYETPKRLKKKYGYFAYVIEGIHSLSKPLSKTSFTYWNEGKEHQISASFVLVSNAERIAGIHFFSEDVKLNDGFFELLICNLTDRRKLLKAIYQLKCKGIERALGCQTIKTKNVKFIFSKPPQKFWCVDGEAMKTEDLVYEIKMMDPISLLVPTKQVVKEENPNTFDNILFYVGLGCFSVVGLGVAEFLRRKQKSQKAN